MNKFLAFLMAGVLCSCSFSQSKTYELGDYFPDIDDPNLDRWQRGILEAYKATILNVKLHCDSIIDLLDQNDVSSVWSNTNSRQQILFSAETLSNLEMREDILLTDSLTEYFNNLKGFVTLGQYLQASNERNNYDSFASVISEISTNCSEFDNQTTQAIASIEKHSENTAKAIKAFFWFDGSYGFAFNYTVDLDQDDRSTLQKVETDENVVYFTGNNRTYPIYYPENVQMYIELGEPDIDNPPPVYMTIDPQKSNVYYLSPHNL